MRQERSIDAHCTGGAVHCHNGSRGILLCLPQLLVPVEQQARSSVQYFTATQQCVVAVLSTHNHDGAKPTQRCKRCVERHDLKQQIGMDDAQATSHQSSTFVACSIACRNRCLWLAHGGCVGSAKHVFLASRPTFLYHNSCACHSICTHHNIYAHHNIRAHHHVCA